MAIDSYHGTGQIIIVCLIKLSSFIIKLGKIPLSSDFKLSYANVATPTSSLKLCLHCSELINRCVKNCQLLVRCGYSCFFHHPISVPECILYRALNNIFHLTHYFTKLHSLANVRVFNLNC